MEQGAMSMSHNLKWALSSGVAALAFGAPAFAQEEAQGETERKLGVITVTSEKRAESIQDVPLSVTAVSGEALGAAGIVDLSTLDKLAPGLQFGQSGTDARPAIRGARTENVSVQQDPIVSFYVDGVYRSLTSQALASMVDVDRVEVLRGPQGTLYGRNAFGGAVNVISNAPSAEPEYGASVLYGNYDRVRVEGYGNVPLSDDLFLRVAISSDTHEPIIENSFNPEAGLRDKDEQYVRAALRWEPTDALDLTLRASRWQQGGLGNSEFGAKLMGRALNRTNLAAVLTSPIERVNPRVGGGNSPVPADPYTIDYDYVPVLDTVQDSVDAELNYDLGWANFKALVGYADFSTLRTADTDLSRFSSGFAGQQDEVESWSQEFQLASTTDGPLEWTTGAYFLQEKKSGLFIFDRLFTTDALTNRPTTTVAPVGSDFNSLAKVDVDSYAIYGQATYSLTDALRLTAGLRYTEDEKDFSRVTTGQNTTPITFLTNAGAPAPVFRDTATFDKTTWKLGGEYDLTEDNLIYASASTGFQSGGFNNSADAVTGGASFDPQEVQAYEIGSKNVFLDGNMIVNLAIFQNEYEDLLANEFVTVGAGTVVTISTNAGEAKATGIEIDASWAASDALLLSANASFQNAEFGRYVIAEPISGAQIDLDGRQVALMPEFTLNLGGTYDIALSGGGRITPSANLYYSSDYVSNDVGYEFSRQDAFSKLDLRLTYNAPEDAWYAEIFGDNITDEATINRTVIFGQGAIVQNFANPSMYGVRLGFKR
jgi:iron complex outermembrane receptor protein